MNNGIATIICLSVSILLLLIAIVSAILIIIRRKKMETTNVQKNNDIALRSFKLSQKEFENGNYELAQTYILNAITHESKLEYLSFYLAIIEKLPPTERSSYIDQAINIYSIALFNNPPEEIVQIMDLIKKMKESMVETEAADSPEPDDNTAESNPACIFAEFERKEKDYAWNKLIKDEKIEDINTLLAKIDLYNEIIRSSEEVSLDSLTKEQQKLSLEAPQELQETKTYVDYVGLKGSVNQYLNESKEELNKDNYNSQYVVCRLQQANTLLSQLWLFDVISIIGSESYTEQLNTLQKKYSDLERTFLEKESEPLCKKIKENIDSEISKIEQCLKKDNKLTPFIEVVQKRYTA